MSAARFTWNDRTRVMGMAYQREATVPVDKIYGIMGASGVEIKPIQGESQDQAWYWWCEAAILQGHVWWALLPPVTSPDKENMTSTNFGNCLIPKFIHQNGASEHSNIIPITPFGEVVVDNGTITLSGRFAGYCYLLRKLGQCYKNEKGIFAVVPTLVLLTQGYWTGGLQVVEAFGVGRYSEKHQVMIAQTLVQNYSKLLRYIKSQKESEFSCSCQSRQHRKSLMIEIIDSRGMNNHITGTTYLTRILYPSSGLFINTAVVLGDYIPTNPLIALDFNAITSAGYQTLLVAELPPNSFASGSFIHTTPLHRVSVTIPLNRAFDKYICEAPIERFSLGGSRCHMCSVSADDREHMAKMQERPQDRKSKKAETAWAMLRKERPEKRKMTPSLRQRLHVTPERFLDLKRSYRKNAERSELPVYSEPCGIPYDYTRNSEVH
ncbi:hypothetical protein GQ44DRAFT_771213 [Phaeosphaeriaceae sp. PMI808]|nr:hypothetical protein GQ44DRAFT_771213 [Phaeosphaeriaceae sp. PMI808]